MMKTLRTVGIQKDADIRTLTVPLADDGRILLHDAIADPNSDSLVQIPDDTDTDIMDAIRPSGFEIVA
jgi:hypothetical protein